MVCASSAVAQQEQVAQGATDPQQQKVNLTTSDSVTVTATGEVRSEQSIDSRILQEAAPGTSPIASLARLPSVSVTSADPYGAYEWALRISVRGFNQNQLGFTLDDVPLGDMSYGNLNGLHISRAIIDENMGREVLSQGTGALETASTSNLGGAIQFYSDDPMDKQHFSIAQTLGSFDGHRTFARYDSGLLPTHTKFYIDGVYQLSNKWKGAGQINQKYFQFNTKLTQFVGSKGVFTFYADYSNRIEVDYQDLNKIWAQKLGYYWDNFGDWGKSIQAANACNGNGSYPSPVNVLASNEDPCDAAYYGGGGLRRDFLTYVNYKTALTDHVTWKTTAYGHYNTGRGLWFTPYQPTLAQGGAVVSPISERTTEYGIRRGGILSSVAYETSRNLLEGGFWYEKESFDIARRFYATSIASPLQSLYDFPSNPFATQWAYNFPTQLFQIHLQDRYKITPKVSVSAGFKTSETYATGNLTEFNTGIPLSPGLVPNAANYAQGSLQSGKPFLPQVGANWKLNRNNEVFADVAENVRAFQMGGNGIATSPWGTTQLGFDALKTTLKPESSWSEEVGYRYNDKRLSAQVNYFHVNFSNRLLAIQQGPAIAGGASLLSNVGGVTTNGVDAAASVQIASDWTFYNAVTYNKSTYDSDVQTATGPIETGGKVAVDTPEFLYKDELSYNKKGFSAHIGADYMSKRYFTYTDDSSVDGRFLADFGTSYHVDEVGLFNELKLQFNIYNLANAKYFSSIGTNGFIAKDPTQVANNTLQVGAPRTFTATLSAKF